MNALRRTRLRVGVSKYMNHVISLILSVNHVTQLLLRQLLIDE